MTIVDHFNDILDLYPGAKLLKEGGQKAVFLITHPQYGRVVLKVGTYSNRQTLERIIREVKTLRTIDSKYYPKNLEFNILDPTRFLIIEEYVDCVPLSDCMSSFSSLDRALTLLLKLVEGLVVIWDKNIVHRDLKPDNILISSEGNPIIIDLGIARLLDEDSITHSSALRGPGTPWYAAPEQLLNRKYSIDFRTDQFNLGIILMQLLLAGEHPFDPKIVGSGNDIVENIINGNWCRDHLDNLNLQVIKPFVSRLLGTEPYQRFRSYNDLERSIIEILNEA